MSTLLIALHITVSIALIVIVLLQMGKGAEAGASFGAGSSNTMFGSSSGGSFMGKVTAAAAVIFMLTSLTLAYFYSSPASKTVMPSSVNLPAAQAPEGFNPAATEPVTAPAGEEQPAAPVDEEKK
ncbi:MAG TPA: preprotein translocase subunit SecG [Geopsychrobacteraceae bacterium]|jgi:preprotein translocase subunit SecG